jgi:predicted dinucleotide-binding enzyme
MRHSHTIAAADSFGCQRASSSSSSSSSLGSLQALALALGVDIDSRASAASRVASLTLTYDFTYHLSLTEPRRTSTRDVILLDAVNPINLNPYPLSTIV